MRFPKETRAAILSAAPHSARIQWPAGSEPKPGRVYWVQSAEDLEAEQRRRESSPDTCAEVLGGMNKRAKKRAETDEEREARINREAATVLVEEFGGDLARQADAYEMARIRITAKTPRKRRRSVRGPVAGQERILVIDAEIQDIGWEAVVELYEDPDPVRHLRVKAKVPAGPNPILGYQEPTETEPEHIPPIRSRQERLEAEEALRISHEASVDHAAAFRAERKLIDQRRKGKRSKLAEEAVARAKKRIAEDPTDRAA